MDIYKSHFGKKLKVALERAGLDQAQLATKMGVKASAVSRWVNGLSFPDDDRMPDLLAALNIDEGFFLEFAPAQPTPAETVGDMTPAELEALVARASKRDNTINLENERLKQLTSYLPPEILSGQVPANPDWQVDFAWFFLTGNKEYLRGFRKDLRESILSALRFHNFDPAVKAVRKQK